MKHALALIALCSVGCAGSLEEARAPKRVGTSPPPSARCIELDNARATTGGFGKGFTLLGGGAGLATIPAKGDLATGLGIGAMGSAAVAATLMYLSEAKGESWARECSAP